MVEKVSNQLTVFFEDPFWVGVFERVEDGKLSVAKVTFGAEPKDGEIYDFVLKNYYRLHFSPAVKTVVKEEKKNPKTRQRALRKQLNAVGIGTKSQQALKMQYEQGKQEKHQKHKNEKLLEAKRLFEQKQRKKKQKHRGR